MKKPLGLGPESYDKNYYLKSLPGIEHLDNLDVIDSAIHDTIRFGEIRPSHHILDFGCGRGALAIALANRGCTAVGVDFSQDAIDFALEYLKRFPEEIQRRVEFKRLEVDELNWEREFDSIVFNQVYEHLHDWELERLIPKFKGALKPNGTLVISTPNLDYVRCLYPLKRISEFPIKIVKEPLRVLRGRSKHASSLKVFIREICKIRYPESEHTRLHINLQTPRSIREFMERQGFRVKLECVDRHSSIITKLASRWWGETIWLACRLPDSA